MFNKRSTFTKYAFTFGIGAVAGAVLALMYTPITGKKFQRKVSDVSEKVADKFQDVQSAVRRVV
jgi:gas vesicle protein